MIYVVAYDLNKETARPKITEERDKTLWAKLSESSYAIETNETPEQVYNRFKKHLDNNDNLYVISLKKPWYGFGPKEVVDWLDKRLPY
jgi:CRISPR/Cas system-associated endoribonuclease Cas2